MMNEEIKQIIADVLKYKGKGFAVLCAIEEMAELTQALLKKINRHWDKPEQQANDLENIFEEIADVYTQLEYLKIIYQISDAKIWEYLDEKIPRKLIPRIEKWAARVAETGNPDANKRILD